MSTEIRQGTIQSIIDLSNIFKNRQQPLNKLLHNIANTITQQTHLQQRMYNVNAQPEVPSLFGLCQVLDYRYLHKLNCDESLIKYYSFFAAYRIRRTTLYNVQCVYLV